MTLPATLLWVLFGILPVDWDWILFSSVLSRTPAACTTTSTLLSASGVYGLDNTLYLLFMQVLCSELDERS